MKSLKSTWDEHLLQTEIYTKSKIDLVKNFQCYASTNQITGKRLFIMVLTTSAKSEFLEKIRFRGLAIQILAFDTHQELTILLLDNSLQDIFIAFIENIIDEVCLCETENEALKKIADVILRWKKLFDKAGGAALSKEQQKGLLGELLLFKSLLKEGYSSQSLIGSWVGPEKADKDYMFGLVGIEVKLTTSKYPSIKITNERQLESDSPNRFYLVLYIVDEVIEKGFSLSDLIVEIKENLSDDAVVLQTLNNKLALTGFVDEDAEYYNQRYSVKRLNIYNVDKEFPRITGSGLPVGVYNVSYSIELSACEIHRITTSESISELINGY